MPPKPFIDTHESRVLDVLKRWIPAKTMPVILVNHDWYMAVADEDTLTEALDGVTQIRGEWVFYSFFKGDDVPMVALIGVPCEPKLTQMVMF